MDVVFWDYGRFPLANWATVGVLCLFALLDVYALFRIIIPQLG
jgi:hypothetical protein